MPTYQPKQKIMKKWNLFAVRGAEPVKETLTRVSTFSEAEEVAKKLFDEYDDGNYPDLCVFCTHHGAYYNEYMDFHDEEDFPVYARVCGEMQWNRMHVGEFCMIGMLYDEDFIEEIREEDEANKPRHIYELTEDELQELFCQVKGNLGSMYISDYQNSLRVDEHEVYDYMEGYTDELDEEYGDDWYSHANSADFAEYCLA